MERIFCIWAFSQYIIIIYKGDCHSKICILNVGKHKKIELGQKWSLPNSNRNLC